MSNDFNSSKLKEPSPRQRRIAPDSLDNRFSYHPPVAPGKKEAHEEVREVMGNVADYLVKKLPPGRETSLAITKIEEGMFWANAAIARNE